MPLKVVGPTFPVSPHIYIEITPALYFRLIDYLKIGVFQLKTGKTQESLFTVTIIDIQRGICKSSSYTLWNIFEN